MNSIASEGHTVKAGADLEDRIVADGYVFQPVAPVEDINAAIEDGCNFCLCQGAVEIRPHWRGARLRLVVVSHCCGNTEER